MHDAARVPVLLIAGALGAVALAGCFGAPSHDDPSPQIVQLSGLPVGEVPVGEVPVAPAHPTAPLEPITDEKVLGYCPAVSAEHYDRLVLAVELVYICRADSHHPTDGETTYGPWQEATQVLDPATLLRAYSVPDAPQSTAACTGTKPLPAPDPLVIWVSRAGVTSAYYAPVDVCGWPQTRAAQDYARAFFGGRQLLAIDTGTPKWNAAHK